MFQKKKLFDQHNDVQKLLKLYVSYNLQIYNSLFKYNR